MRLVIYYLVFMIAGDIASYVLGLGIERVFGPVVSLWAFLFLYFLFLWVAWILAVHFTKDEAEAVPATSLNP